MEPHDIYFFLGGFLPLIGVIGFLNARVDKTALWFPVSVFFVGIGSMVVAWVKIDGVLTLTGFGDSVLRIVAAIL